MTTFTETTSPSYPSDITFVIHYRKDSEDRKHNLLTSGVYLRDTFPDCEIIIVNDDKVCDEDFKESFRYVGGVKPVFLENHDEFRKALSFNVAAERAKGQVLCFWDVDVLINKKYVIEAYEKIVSGQSDHVYPFNGTFVDVQKDLFQDFLTRYNFEHIEKLWKHKHPSLHFASGESPGGCTMISREAFDRMKGYDERFIGWGFEDTDFLYRSRKVNRVAYLENENAICWHLHHENAKRMENPHYHNNLLIFNHNASC